MIRPLRVRHRRMLLLVALVAGTLLVAALVARRPMPTVTLPAAISEAAP